MSDDDGFVRPRDERRSATDCWRSDHCGKLHFGKSTLQAPEPTNVDVGVPLTEHVQAVPTHERCWFPATQLRSHEQPLASPEQAIGALAQSPDVEPASVIPASPIEQAGGPTSLLPFRRAFRRHELKLDSAHGPTESRHPRLQTHPRAISDSIAT